MLSLALGGVWIQKFNWIQRPRLENFGTRRPSDCWWESYQDTYIDDSITSAEGVKIFMLHNAKYLKVLQRSFMHQRSNTKISANEEGTWCLYVSRSDSCYNKSVFPRRLCIKLSIVVGFIKKYKMEHFRDKQIDRLNLICRGKAKLWPRFSWSSGCAADRHYAIVAQNWCSSRAKALNSQNQGVLPL